MPFTPPPPPPALLLTGAQVWTDAGPRWGQAVLVDGGRIKALGTRAALRKAHPGAREVRLAGGTLLPGLIEGHAHVEGLGTQRRITELTGTASLTEALRRVRAWATDHPEGWIQGRGWDQNRWPSKSFPLASDLDAAIGDRPAVMERVDGHALWVNTAALRAAGIDRNTPDPAGGRILRDAKGEPTGVLIDGAMALVERRVPPPAPEEREARILDGLSHLRALGFTSVADMGIGAETLAAYRRLGAANRLPIRVFAYLSQHPDLLRTELAKPRNRNLGFFQVQGVKFILDGALGSRGARLLAPYADAPDTLGLWVADPAKAKGDYLATLRAGYQPALHAIGDAANRAALDLVAKSPKGSLPPRIEHAQIVTAADAARFGKLGVIASVQPVHCTSDHAWTPDRLGPSRVHEAFPWRALLKGGAVLALGSDAPVEDPDPYAGLAAAETRKDADGRPEGGFLPDQRLTRTEALQAFTAGNGQALGHRDLGVLRPGAVADLLWVEIPILEPSPEGLRKLRPGRLWVNGTEVSPGR